MAKLKIKSTIATAMVEMANINLGKYTFVIKLVLDVMEFEMLVKVVAKKFQKIIPVKIIN